MYLYIKIEVEIFERHTTESELPFHITCYIDLTQPKAKKRKITEIIGEFELNEMLVKIYLFIVDVRDVYAFTHNCVK